MLALFVLVLKNNIKLQTMTELEKYIHTYFGVSKEEVTKISTFFKHVDLKKGDYFLKTGRHSDRLGFVQTGIVREFVFI